METSRTNAQYKRNDIYNFLYEIEWILSVLWILFVRQTRQIRQIQPYGNQALRTSLTVHGLISFGYVRWSLPNHRKNKGTSIALWRVVLRCYSAMNSKLIDEVHPQIRNRNRKISRAKVLRNPIYLTFGESRKQAMTVPVRWTFAKDFVEVILQRFICLCI